MAKVKNHRASQREKRPGPLGIIRRRYVSDQMMVDHLDRLGLGRIDRSAISRWCDLEAKSAPLPQRARLALSRLATLGQGAEIRIAHHSAPAAVPLVLVYTSPGFTEASANGRDDHKTTSTEGIRVRHLPVADGAAALEKLRSGEADLALASDELLSSPQAMRRIPKSFRLCGLAETGLLGVYLQEAFRYGIQSPLDYADPTKVIGYPASTAIGTILGQQLPLRMPDKQLRPFATAEDACAALRRSDIHCLVAPPDWLTHVKSRIKKGVEPIEPGHCGFMKLSLFVNLSPTLPAKSVRVLLRRLYEVTRDEESFAVSVRDADEKVLARFLDIDWSEFKGHLKEGANRYKVDLSTDAILALWEKEVSDASAITTIESSP